MSQYDEGHTLAGWIGVAVATVGCSVLGAGICIHSAALIVAGLAVTVTSVLVTWTLHLTGWGKPSGIRPRDQWGMRVRDLSALEGHPGCWGCRLAGRGSGRGRGRRTAESEAPVGQAAAPVGGAAGAAGEREPVAVGAER
ncbi:HGxxPAAW family protein [Streptomyces viridochromogenes]|uniref:HGxxPAAW family protein n=1 Tax=Streptomyces viridochromogenes TaxID=1938 RepID=UPI0015C50F16|nr:HGxxPAAW family protein [Streptomyces viridochromogenes]